MDISQDILDYFQAHQQEAVDLLCQLAQIPAPSNHEEKRAQFCKEWLEKQGAKGVYVDEALNVLYPIGIEQGGPITVYMAHSDVVFPDTDPLPLKIEDGKIFCPGVGDDTANAVALLMTAKYIAEKNLTPKEGVLLAVNSGEEGLGNLKGVRKVMEDFGSRVKEFVTFDGNADRIVNEAVGSKRYQVTIRTEGGHSYNAFGNRNAIAYMASMIHTLYSIEPPPMGKTTYNVGTIQGGTSVNTIAQSAQMLYEYRSDNRSALLVMEEHFTRIIEQYRSQGLDVEVELVGDRPCADAVDQNRQAALMARAAAAIKRHYNVEPIYLSGSTDCNIPLSMGIPSICPGCILGGGAHTRGEYVHIDSILPGLKAAAEMILHHF